MSHRFWISMGVLAIAIAAAAPAIIIGQAPAPAAKKAAPANQKSSVPHTPWGDPDLQGVWNDATSTPLQRPTTVGQKDVISDANEAEGFEEQLASDLNRDRRDGGAEVDVNRAYNEHWMDARRLKITADRRTSLIVDPPDGRIPPLVPLSPERQKIRAEQAA